VQEWGMKKDFLIHFSSLVLFFLLITLIKRWFNFNVWPFWIGGIIGTLLPDIDHLIYVKYLRPQELLSQRVNYLMADRNILKSLELLYETRYERTKLVFHTVMFQAIFIGLTFFVITSSGSLFGKGIVLAFLLHLLVDQVVDLKSLNNLDNWFRQLPIVFDRQKYNLYLSFNLLLLLLFIFFL
jgi:hypothetical protein